MAQVQLQRRRTAFAVGAALRLCQVWAPVSRHAVLDARGDCVVQSSSCIRSLKGSLRVPFRLIVLLVIIKILKC